MHETKVFQNLKDGTTEVADMPYPRVGSGHLLRRTTRTLVSASTERMLVDFSTAGFIEKAHQRPDKMRMVRDKVYTDGLIPPSRRCATSWTSPCSCATATWARW
jgi:hypothetical protein